MEMTPFKPGDWIIASRPMVWIDDIGLFASQPIERRDNSFTSIPIKVIAVAEAHIVYEISYFKGSPMRHILPLTELEERGFIIAAPELVEVALAKF